MMKCCIKCGVEQEESTHFRPNPVRGFRRDCRACERKGRRTYYKNNRDRECAYGRDYSKSDPQRRNAWKRAWYARNKAHHKNTVRKRLYGLEPGAFDSMMLSQGGKCAICGGAFAGRRACVDHCHSTGRVRGLLCIQCNNILGNSEDSTQRLESAIKYLMRVDETV